MKSIIIYPFLMLTMAFAMTAYGGSATPDKNVAVPDSAIDVVAWFNRHDTATYWVNESSWNISETDTISTASVAMKVRVNVVDSTANGYKMEYTFLEFPVASLTDSASAMHGFQSRITEKLGSKIVGTTVRFETDEYGHITKYNNLDQIKKQANSLFKEAIKEFSKLPELQALKEMGLDVKEYAKDVDTDQLVDGYLEELNLLFMNHGQSIKIGEFTEHEDAKESSYENTTYVSVELDADDGSYSILYDVTNVVPHNEIKALVSSIVESLNDDSVKDSFNENFDSQVKDDGTYEDYLKMDYLVNGWPYLVVRQKAAMLGRRGKVKQTVISLDSYSFGK